jgi:hypothetical protein
MADKDKIIISVGKSACSVSNKTVVQDILICHSRDKITLFRDVTPCIYGFF